MYEDMKTDSLQMYRGTGMCLMPAFAG
jgi:hypothetical protein